MQLFLLLVTSASDLLVHTIRFCSVVFGVTSSLAVIHTIYRDYVWTTETVTSSCVALSGRIPAVYDQRYNCHNLRDGGHRPPATMFTTPRWLQRQQQAYRLRIKISAYPTCIRFNAPVTGVPVGISPSRLVWNN